MTLQTEQKEQEEQIETERHIDELKIRTIDDMVVGEKIKLRQGRSTEKTPIQAVYYKRQEFYGKDQMFFVEPIKSEEGVSFCIIRVNAKDLYFDNGILQFDSFYPSWKYIGQHHAGYGKIIKLLDLKN